MQLGFQLEDDVPLKEDVIKVIQDLSTTCKDCRLYQLHKTNQGLVHRGNPLARIAVVGIAPGDAEMMDVEEPIPTPKGWVRNGDLKAGDLVFGQDGKTYEVLHAHPVKEEQVYRVFFDDKTSVDVHAGHLWTTLNREERSQVTRRSERVREQYRKRLGLVPKEHLRGLNIKEAPTGTVRRTDEIFHTLLYKDGDSYRINHSIDVAKPVELPDVQLPIHPYALGCWLGDGNAKHNGFYSVDEEILERLESIAGIHCKNWKTEEGKCPSYGMSIPGKKGANRSLTTGRLEAGESFYSELVKLKVIGNKHIPYNYLWSSGNQRLELLRGLMDTDGACSKRGQVRFSNTNLSLAEGVYHLAASLGLKPTLTGPFVDKPKVNKKTKQVYGKNQPHWFVTWSSSLAVFGLTRKAERLPKKTSLVTKRRYIVEVQKLSNNKKMRCLTVSNPTGLYLFGKNFNVTHNTEKGIPLVGPSGKEFEKWMRFIGVDTSKDVFITNVVNCQPEKKKDNKTGRMKQRDPDKDELAACFGPKCMRVLRAMPNLEVVVTLGWLPALQFLGAGPDGDMEPKTKTHEGQWFETSLLPGIAIFCLSHPAEILYTESPDKRMIIERCLKNFKREYIETRKIIPLVKTAQKNRESLGGFNG